MKYLPQHEIVSARKDVDALLDPQGHLEEYKRDGYGNITEVEHFNSKGVRRMRTLYASCHKMRGITMILKNGVAVYIHIVPTSEEPKVLSFIKTRLRKVDFDGDPLTELNTYEKIISYLCNNNIPY